MKLIDIVEKYGLDMEEIKREFEQTISSENLDKLETAYDETLKHFEIDTIIKGKVVSVLDDEVVVDVGYKSEGIVPISEFRHDREIEPGSEIEVYLEAIEDDSGLVVLSKLKADGIRTWERIISTHKEGDVVKGRVIRKIKGGLLVDIGVPVFLPASQVTNEPYRDIDSFLGKEVEAKIIKIDEPRMNIIISRRKLVEERRIKLKEAVFASVKEGDIVKGTVKAITDFGAFVDLGGVDGLLHVSDMTWGRISHPSEMVAIGDSLSVRVLKIDKEQERISVGLKQTSENPWTNADKKFPVGAKFKGRVVNILPYGCFVELQPGVEGLVHVSEMSWTRRVNHPSELVTIGDIVEVIVLKVDMNKQEISLGMKQVETDPWTQIAQMYPKNTIVEGTVRHLTKYGAFVEIQEGIDGLLHVNDMSWTKKITHPSQMLKKGDKIKAIVLSVDQEKKKVALGMKQLYEDPWESIIPEKFSPGTEVTGIVSKILSYGILVKIDDDLEGLVHISEIPMGKGEQISKLFKPGDEVKVRVLRVEPDQRKIGLSMREIPPDATEPEQKPESKTVSKKKKSRPAPPPEPSQETGEPHISKTIPECESKGSAQIPAEPNTMGATQPEIHPTTEASRTDGKLENFGNLPTS